MSVGVSVIVPVHNGEPFLAEAIDSLLAQTHRPLEVVVVDNMSTDDSARIAAAYGDPVRVVEAAPLGPPVARNRGIREATFPLIAFLDADDLFHPEKLERQVAHLASRADLDISLCVAENFWEPGLEEEQRRYAAMGRDRATHAFGTLLTTHEVFDRVGLIDEGLPHGDQIEWFVRAGAAGMVMEALPEVLMRRRMHPASRSHQLRDLDVYLDLAGSLIARRRRAAAPDASR